MRRHLGWIVLSVFWGLIGWGAISEGDYITGTLLVVIGVLGLLWPFLTRGLTRALQIVVFVWVLFCFGIGAAALLEGGNYPAYVVGSVFGCLGALTLLWLLWRRFKSSSEPPPSLSRGVRKEGATRRDEHV